MSEKNKKIETFISCVFLVIPIFFIDYIFSFTGFLMIGCLVVSVFLFLHNINKVKITIPFIMFAIISIWISITSFIHGISNEMANVYIILFVEGVLLLSYKFNVYLLVKFIELCGAIHTIATIAIALMPVGKINVFLSFLLGNKYITNYNWRIVQGYNCGITLQPGENALYILIFFAVMFSKWVITFKNRYIIFMILSFIAILTTGKRTPIILSMLISLIIFGIVKGVKITKKQLIILINFIIIVILSGIYITKRTQLLNALYSKILVADSIDDVSGGRFDIWKNAVHEFYAHPIIGSGIKKIYQEYGIDVHNNYLQFLAELGIIGLILLIVLIVYLIRECYKNIYHVKIRLNDVYCVNYNITSVFCIFMVSYIIVYAFVGNPFIDFIPLQMLTLINVILFKNEENNG